MKILPAVASLVGEINFDPEQLHQKYIAERDKRLRPDGVKQYIEPKGELSQYVDDPYVEPGFTGRRFRRNRSRRHRRGVRRIADGCPSSRGRLRQYPHDRDGAATSAGTWYWNRYPGAMCDVESYIYLPLLEELEYIPKHKYSFAPEIFEHSQTDRAVTTIFTRMPSADRRSHRCSGMRTDSALDRQDESRRPIHVTVHRDGERTVEPSETSRAFRASTISKATRFIPADGTTLHRRRQLRQSVRAQGQARRHHRYRRNRDSVHSASGRVRESSFTSSSAHHRRSTSATIAKPIRSGPSRYSPAGSRRRMENFNILVSGGDQDKDLVSDGWTDIFRNLTARRSKEASRTLGRRLDSEERDAAHLAGGLQENEPGARARGRDRQ